MSEENKMVSEVVKDMRSLCVRFKDVIVARSFIVTWANEVEVAHNREILAERSLSNDHIVGLQDKLATKDAEIAKLKDYIAKNDINGDTAVACLTEIKEAAEEKMAEITSLRALVGGLADVAERFVSCKATECETVCGVGSKCIHKKAIELVAKAREVLK